MKSIPFSSIVLDTSNPQDGQLTAMCNLRHTTTGSIEPTGNPEKVYNVTTEHGEPDREIIYIHKTGEYENWISHNGVTLYFEATNVNGIITPVKQLDQGGLETDAVGRPFYSGVKKITGISSIGNTLIVSCDSGILYFLFKTLTSGEYEYKFISINEDDIRVKIEKTGEGKEAIIIPFAFNTRDVSDIIKEVLCAGYTTNASIYEKMSELKSKGLLQNAALLRWAVRMYDGSYTLQSAPILILNRNAIHVNGVVGGLVAVVYFEYYKLKVSIVVPNYIKDSDIYIGIDIFMNEIPYYDTTDTYNRNINAFKLTGDRYTFDGDPFYTDDKKLIERISSNANFYRIAQYDFNSRLYPIEETLDLSDVLTNLQFQPELTDDSYSHNQTFAKKLFNYNNKLHIANIEQKLYKGYPLYMFISYAGTEKTIDKFISTTYINTAVGEVKVSREQDYLNNNQFVLLSPFLSYPDSRAYKMVISILYKERGESGNYEYYLFKKSFQLKPHDFLNLAYYLPSDKIEPIDITGDSISSSEIPTAPSDENNIESNPNKVKVSATDNLFVFPVEQTYTIGTGKIIGMAASTPALSQGQYGQFPLYVFTDDGIYMMQVGTGDVIYTNTLPVSRDVCDNPDSILSLDNSVFFSSNNKLFILSGYNSKCISDSLKTEYYPDPGSLSIYSGTGPIFDEYTIYGYNYNYGEIIVRPDEAHIALVYDIRNKIWREKTIPSNNIISQFISVYPILYAIDDYNSDVYDLSFEDKPYKGYKNIRLQTAPIILGSTGFKKIEKAIIRTIISGNIKVSVYGSNDNISFKKVMEINVKSESLIHDIPIQRISSSWRYFYFSITGDIGFDSTITRIDIQEKTTFNTKLR